MLNKAQFVDALAEKQGVSKKQAKENLEAVLDTMVDSLDHGGVNLTGHLSIEAKDTAARTGRNPQTGSAIEIPAGKRVSLKARAKLKDAVK